MKCWHVGILYLIVMPWCVTVKDPGQVASSHLVVDLLNPRTVVSMQSGLPLTVKVSGSILASQVDNIMSYHVICCTASTSLNLQSLIDSY